MKGLVGRIPSKVPRWPSSFFCFLGHTASMLQLPGLNSNPEQTSLKIEEHLPDKYSEQIFENVFLDLVYGNSCKWSTIAPSDKHAAMIVLFTVSHGLSIASFVLLSYDVTKLVTCFGICLFVYS